MLLRRRALIAAVIGLAACGQDRIAGTGDKTQPPEIVAAERPRLVVLVVIDQLPSWSFDAQRGELEGGIGRMLRDGTYWPRASYPYATTHTGPGHATIGSGTTPSVHGIIANRWFDPKLARLVTVDEDPAAIVLDPHGGPPRIGGVSNMRLEVPGIADALHAHHPDARVVSIGWKSRAALLMTGKHPDLALWFDNDAGAMTTSTAFVAELPPWIRALATAERASALWAPLDAARVEKLAARPDASTDESNPLGLGNVFPHPIDDATRNKSLAFLPEANARLVDTALAAVRAEHLGADATPDLLAVTFSPHDFAGHAWCQESWERVDHLLRIDRELERLFDALDAELGQGAWAAVLTSDHGTLPSRSKLAAEGKATPFFFSEDLAVVAQNAAQAILGPGEWVLGATTIEVTMTAAFHARSAHDRGLALDAVVEKLRALGLAWVGRRDAIAADACDGDDVAAMVCRSVRADRSGDVYVVAPEWGLINDDKEECTAHGSPWAYDREVPIVVMAPGYAAGVRSYSPSTLQIAPTLAALLGVPPPAAAKAEPLPQAP